MVDALTEVAIVALDPQGRGVTEDGVAVAEMLMALYRSAELGQVVKFPAPELESYVPPVARA